MTAGHPIIVRATTRFGAVVGWPIDHSRSPILHNAAFAACGLDAVLIALSVAPADLPTVVRGLAASACLGASVTVPHKEAVGALCAHVTGAAALIGAVNCLAFENGSIVGHNTDGDGFIDSLRAEGIDPAGRRAVILGGGGAARAVHAGLTAAGASADVVARRPESARWTKVSQWSELASHLASADLLVDATSAGLTAAGDTGLADAIPLAALRPDALVMSLVYHRVTELLRRAAARGLAVLDGRGMLVHQGSRAFRLWTGIDAPVAVMRAALDDSLA